MRTISDQPADTTMMGIVHDALRRDLGRATAAMSSEPSPPDRQRVAIAVHVRWLMDFLHSHHVGEDQGLWPLVRAHNPQAGDMLDQMDADHASGLAPGRWTPSKRGCPSWEDSVGSSLLSTRTRPCGW